MRWAWVVVGVALAAAAGADDKPNKTLEPFQGTWKCVSNTNSGKALAEAEKLTLYVKGNERVIKDGDDVVAKATFTVDSAKTPKTIDITVSDGPLAGRTVRGIYELKDGTWTVCLSLVGDARPT